MSPFNFDETSPADSANVSAFPSNERSARAAVLGSMDVDHDAEATGEHKKVTLQEQGADPASAANKGFVYAKDVGGVTELFYEDSGGNVSRITAGGLSANDALLRVATASAAQRTMAAALLLANNIELQGLDTGAVARSIAQVNAFDEVEIGDVALITRIKVVSFANLLADNGVSAPRILTALDEGPGNGFDADTLDGVQGADHLRWDATRYFASAEQSVADGADDDVAHGLAVTPKLVGGYLVCKSNVDGYTAGDKIFVFPSRGDGTSRGITIGLNAAGTSLFYVVGNNGFTYWDKSSGASQVGDPADWRLVLQAWS